MNSLKKIGVIVLAAGSSSRMGSPKQLLSFQHKSLLNITIEAAVNAVEGSVVVILGDNYDLIAGDIAHRGLCIVGNPGWEEGISASIRLGMSVLMAKEASMDGVILMVCDQPFITSLHLQTLLLKAEITGQCIVASSYAETLGVPALFCKHHFNDLMSLKGAEGAKTLILKYMDEVAPVPFTNGEIDIDTPDDYRKLINK